VLVTTSAALARQVAAALERQTARLERREAVESALRTSRLIVVDGLATALEVSNRYAPEHLILQVESAREWLPQVRNAGSVFVGAWTPETLGDYCSGTNHVLPTYGHARAYGGLGVLDFARCMTIQEATPEGLRSLGPVARELAQLETLGAHANAVTVRLDALDEAARA